jgi:hypothetical protein
MNRILIGLALLISIVIAASSPLFAQDSLPSDEELISVIRENFNAWNRKDLQGIMSTIDPASPYYSQSETMTGQVLQAYELKIELKSVKVIDKKIDEARLRIVQVTKKVSGPAFRDNETISVQTLKKIQGKWKIADSKLEDVKYYDAPQKKMDGQG